jgi:hypothetical protein
MKFKAKDAHRRMRNQRNHLGRACEGGAQGWNWSYHRPQQPLGTSSYLYQGYQVGCWEPPARARGVCSWCGSRCRDRAKKKKD